MQLAGLGTKAAPGGGFHARWQARNEVAQIKLRIGGGLLAMFVMSALHLWGGLGPFDQPLPWVSAYVLGSMAWWGLVKLGFWHLRARLLVASVLEQGMFACVLASTGEQGALLLGVPIFTSLGHGLRFGPGVAFFNSILAASFMAVAFHGSPYWSSMPGLAMGMCVAVLSVPVYGTLLNRRLLAQHREAEQRAAAWESASKTDPLTGLANRVALMEALERVHGTQRAADRVCALFYVDLDGFKAVNDQAGHAAGDEVLMQVAQALRDAVRADDVVARLGGDEFAILTRGLAHAEGAQAVADKVLHALGHIRVAGHEKLRVGGSIGACLLPDADITSPREAVRVADELMLAIKREGKGAVRIKAHAGGAQPQRTMPG
jgi:diguanylate cyclase (GGDEF)-like protein